jgi:uncharacterized membrane protein YfcA
MTATNGSQAAAHAPASSTFAATAAVGLAAGFLSGVFGVGGGILIVPALVLVLHMEQRLAHGTSLAAVLPIALASLVTYWSHGNVDWPVAFWLAIGAVGGAVLGTRLLHVLPERALGYAFAIVLIATAIRLFIPVEASGQHDVTVATGIALIVLGLVTGILAGLLGVGGGIIMVPGMIVLFGLTPVLAKGTSLAVIIPTAIMGTWRNRKKANADLRVAAIVGVAGIVSAVAGGWVSDQMSDELANVLFAILLVVVAVRMIWGLEKGRPTDAEAS